MSHLAGGRDRNPITPPVSGVHSVDCAVPTNWLHVDLNNIHTMSINTKNTLSTIELVLKIVWK